MLEVNKFLFQTIGSTNHLSGWHCVNNILVQISKKGAINATKKRHRVSSILAKIQVTDQEKELIF